MRDVPVIVTAAVVSGGLDGPPPVGIGGATRGGSAAVLPPPPQPWIAIIATSTSKMVPRCSRLRDALGPHKITTPANGSNTAIFNAASNPAGRVGDIAVVEGVVMVNVEVTADAPGSTLPGEAQDRIFSPEGRYVGIPVLP